MFRKWQYLQENIYVGVFFNNVQASLKKTPTQVFSCEYCEIFKNTYFEEHFEEQDVERSSL